VSGNVSLYNETEGRPILPTPTIGAVGVIDDISKAVGSRLRTAGQALVLIGATQGWLGQSLYLRELCGREEGAPPPVDLAVERRNGDFVRGLIADGTATAVHDVSDGGLLVALAEMAMASGIGAELETPPMPGHAFWFGEDQARYVVTADPGKASRILDRAQAAGVPVRELGTTAGDALVLAGERTIPVAILRESSEGWLPAFMAGGHPR